jgi:hypothetical protein
MRSRQVESTAAVDARPEDEPAASVVIRGHAFIQNIRRGHNELGVDVAPINRRASAFDELRLAK